MSINIQALKIAPLLARYLYEQKRLDLPGIGRFYLDPSALVEPENNKQGKPVLLEGLRFESDLSTPESPELISFISSHSGKMKPLASADLASHIELAQQFLNIGKPFVMEGIGNLSKVKGGYEFTPGYALTEKFSEYSPATVAAEEPDMDYKGVLYHEAKQPVWRKPLIAGLVVFGLVLAVWGGYTIYKNSKEAADKDTVAVNDTQTPATQEPQQQPQQQAPVTPDTTQTKKDTTATPPVTAPVNTPVMSSPAGTYKFVVEVAGRTRGLDRFRALKSWGLAVQMETTDSLNFTIFFRLPANASDTLRIRDSLSQLYTPYWTKAFVRN